MKWKQFLRFFNNWEGKAKTQMGHSYEAFTYLFGRNIFIHLLSANNNFPIDLLKLAITGNFGSIVDPWTQTIYFFPKLAGNFIVESRINPWLPVTAISKGLQKNFCLLRADELRYFSQTKGMYMLYEWKILVQSMEMCSTIFSCLGRPPTLSRIVQWWSALIKTTQYKTNQKTHVKR